MITKINIFYTTFLLLDKILEDTFIINFIEDVNPETAGVPYREQNMVHRETAGVPHTEQRDKNQLK